jgi:AcrR family transcriptional regulator
MPTPHRILRAQAQARDPKPIQFSTRELERHDRILTVGRVLMAANGRQNLTFAGLAVALSLGTTTLRRHFADLDALLGEILAHHLGAIATALGAIPNTDPDAAAKRRAAYIAFTRTALGGFTEAHLLLLRDRHQLPEDVRTPLEDTRFGLAQILGGPLAEDTMSFLDSPNLDIGDIEFLLAALVTRRAAQAEQNARATPPRTAPIPATTPDPAPPVKTPTAPVRRFALVPPDPDDPEDEKSPGDWIFDANLPGVSRAPPVPA